MYYVLLCNTRVKLWVLLYSWNCNCQFQSSFGRHFLTRLTEHRLHLLSKVTIHRFWVVWPCMFVASSHHRIPKGCKLSRGEMNCARSLWYILWSQWHMFQQRRMQWAEVLDVSDVPELYKEAFKSFALHKSQRIQRKCWGVDVANVTCGTSVSVVTAPATARDHRNRNLTCGVVLWYLQPMTRIRL